MNETVNENEDSSLDARKGGMDADRKQRLTLAIRHKGWTQLHLAEKLNIKRSTAGALMRGEIPGDKHLGKLAEVLEVSLPWLIYGVSPPSWAAGGIAPGSAAESLINFLEELSKREFTLAKEIFDLIGDGQDPRKSRTEVTLENAATVELTGPQGVVARHEKLAQVTLHNDVVDTLLLGQKQIIAVLEKGVPSVTRSRIESRARRLESAWYNNCISALKVWRSAKKESDHVLAIDRTIRYLISRQYGENDFSLAELKKETSLEAWVDSPVADDEPPF